MISPYKSGYKGVNPISDERSMVLVGSYTQDSSAQMLEDLADFCSEWDADVEVDEAEIKNVPLVGGLELENAQYELRGATVKLVGDAASLGNRMTGTDLSRAAHSARLAVETESSSQSYVEQLKGEVHKGWLRERISNHVDIGQEASIAEILRKPDSISYEKLFVSDSDREMGREIFRILTGK
jgi:flavin-dependent dehydrogenase